MHSKMKRLRGMRDLTTIQGLSGRTLPNSREQIVAEQARLEHERSRLEREQAMWQENLERTSERLSAVNDRLALLNSALEPTESSRSATAARGGKSSSESAQEHIEWHAVVLEY